MLQEQVYTYVSEELSSVETHQIHQSKYQISPVSEELSSVETDVRAKCIEEAKKFQKNLVVWKPVSFHHLSISGIAFQKNLVVWKPDV